MTARANWRDDVACRDADPELFFPIGSTGSALRQAGEAKRICRACPAQTQCLAWALANGVTDGVWGGTTQDERRAIRSLLEECQPARKTRMAKASSQQSMENREYVRRLLNEKQPGFSAALELAMDLVGRELRSERRSATSALPRSGDQ
jgi:WhiB family redox-sensing transcriptional regulator